MKAAQTAVKGPSRLFSRMQQNPRCWVQPQLNKLAFFSLTLPKSLRNDFYLFPNRNPITPNRPLLPGSLILYGGLPEAEPR